MKRLNPVYGKPLVMVCKKCHKVRRFGKFVDSIFSYEQLQARFETILVICPNCEKGLA